MNFNRSLVLASIALALALSGCSKSSDSGSSNSGAPPTKTTPNLRPTNSPDVVIISVSGNVSIEPRNNTAYLGNTGDAAEMVEDLFWKLGNTIASRHFISCLYSYDKTTSGNYNRPGFLELLDTLLWINEDWIRGYDNPTRIVIIAHSHGCVWAHMATNLLPAVPIEYLISLDGTSISWTFLHYDHISSFYSQNGNPFPWDIRYPSDNWSIPGLSSLQDIEDIVMPNVYANLEVRSNSLVLADWQLNHRTNGTRYNVFTFDSTRDDHSMVHHPNGESMPWVLSQLALLESIKSSFLGPLKINVYDESSQATIIHPVYPEGNPLEVEAQEGRLEEIENSEVGEPFPWRHFTIGQFNNTK